MTPRFRHCVVVRGWWKPMNGEVRETAATSSDDGKTWKPWFDLVFRPRASSKNAAPLSAADDKEIIAALDTQYQAAVKENDAATMDRILADDFILVTGSGKTYTKADLLEESRSGRVHYDRQDDTKKTVRIWAKQPWLPPCSRKNSLVQRYLCSHSGGLALRFRPILVAGA